MESSIVLSNNISLEGRDTFNKYPLKSIINTLHGCGKYITFSGKESVDNLGNLPLATVNKIEIIIKIETLKEVSFFVKVKYKIYIFGEVFMPLVKAQCTNCGAALEVDNTKEAAVCPYCNTPYIVEKAINNYTTNITNNIQAQTVNIINQKDDYEIVAGTLIKYTGKSADIVIPDEVIQIASAAIPRNVRSIVFGKGMKEIKPFSCSDMKELNSIIIPNGITSIGEFAFNGCESLNNINLPNNIKEIPRAMFFKCQSLTSFIIPSSVINIGVQAFAFCNKLTSITVDKNNPKYDSRDNCNAIIETANNKLVSGNNNTVIPDSVKVIGEYAFEGCNFKSIAIPNGVTTIEDAAFYLCKELTSITIPDSVTSIGRCVFDGCEKLMRVNVPKNLKIDKNIFHNENIIISHNGAEKQGGCYIATCVYGSYDCPQVWTLRRYRDNVLGSTWYGRLFIKFYYAVSPTVVKWFGNTKWFKNMWQKYLNKKVNRLNQEGFEDTPYKDKDWK